MKQNFKTLLSLIHSLFIIAFVFGQTVYVQGKTYKTTGKPLVKRSSIPKTAFLKSLGLNHIPSGYQIDHIQPLSQGGADVVENMQLLTVGQHKLKTAIERGDVADLNNSNVLFTSFDNNDRKPVGIRKKDDMEVYTFNSPKSVDKELYSKKMLYKGSRGGSFYYNANGKKTYVKSLKPVEAGDELNLSNNWDLSSPSTSSPPSSHISPSVNSPSSIFPQTNSTNNVIQTGPRGGQFYINSNGKKTYIKKN